jgi:hypothetical protein
MGGCGACVDDNSSRPHSDGVRLHTRMNARGSQNLTTQSQRMAARVTCGLTRRTNQKHVPSPARLGVSATSWTLGRIEPAGELGGSNVGPTPAVDAPGVGYLHRPLTPRCLPTAGHSFSPELGRGERARRLLHGPSIDDGREGRLCARLERNRKSVGFS